MLKRKSSLETHQRRGSYLQEMLLSDLPHTENSPMADTSDSSDKSGNVFSQDSPEFDLL